MQSLTALVSDGFTNPDHATWGLVHLLGADTASQPFRKLALGAVLRMHSAIYRRYSLKYSLWPFCLFRLVGSEWTEAERGLVADELLAAQDCCLDTFARGFRQPFRAKESILSQGAAACLQVAMDSMRVVTDFSERSHAQCKCAARSATSPRAFSHTSNEVLLKQLMVVHKKNGGLPLEALRTKEGAKEKPDDLRLACPLVLAPLQGRLDAPDSSQLAQLALAVQAGRPPGQPSSTWGHSPRRRQQASTVRMQSFLQAQGRAERSPQSIPFHHWAHCSMRRGWLRPQAMLCKTPPYKLQMARLRVLRASDGG